MDPWRAVWADRPHHYVPTADNYQADFAIWVEGDLEALQQVAVPVKGVSCELLRGQEPREDGVTHIPALLSIPITSAEIDQAAMHAGCCTCAGNNDACLELSTLLTSRSEGELCLVQALIKLAF